MVWNLRFLWVTPRLFPEFSQKPLEKASYHNIWFFNAEKLQYNGVIQSIGFIVGSSNLIIT